MTPSRRFQRSLVVLATLAGILVPAAIAPARTIQIPQTLARTANIDGGGTARLSFPATHVAFSWRGEEGSGVRFRTGDGTWMTAPEAHDLEDGSTRYSGVLYVDRPRTLQVEQLGWGLTPASDIRVHYMNTADGPLRTVTVPSVANAAATTPNVVSRAEWGADESLKDTDGGCQRIFYPLQQLFVHHTAGSNADPDPYATMRAVYHFHTQSRNWCDIGYNFVVAQDGTIFEGRWSRAFQPWETPTSEDGQGNAVAGAHVSGLNSGSVGVSMMGNFSTAQVPVAARTSLVQLLSWIADRHNLDPEASHDYRNPETGLAKKLPVIAGHRDGGQTDCPGDNLYSALPSIRKEVTVQIGSGRQKALISLSPSARRVTYGSSTSVTGVIEDESGAPLAGRPLTIYTKAFGQKWKVHASVTSNLDGSFASSLTPEKGTQVAAVYAGDAATWEGQSPKRQIAVTPVVTLVARDAQSDLSGTYRYPASSTSASIGGSVRPALRGQTVRVLFFQLQEDGTEVQLAEKTTEIDAAGAYGVPFKIRASGVRYRASAWYESGGGYSAARSNSIFFQRES